MVKTNKILFLDDLIDTGRTAREVVRKIRSQAFDKSIDIEFIGAYLYEGREYLDSVEFEKRTASDD
jgi:hypoxanthine phosphoribosyltransferase